MNRFVLCLWQWGDRVYRRVRRFDYEDRAGTNVFRLRVRPYAGPALDLPNGETVRGGDWVGILHLYNLRLQQLLQGIGSENRRVLLVRREVQRSLPGLAEFVHNHPGGRRIKALVGVTLLNRGVEPLGFFVTPLEDSAWYRFKNQYMRLFVRLCHPDGGRRLRGTKKPLELKRVVMSLEELLSRYGAPELEPQ